MKRRVLNNCDSSANSECNVLINGNTLDFLIFNAMGLVKLASLGAGAVGLPLIVLASGPSISRILRLRGRPHPRGHDESPELYEDDDGVATDESQRAFSDQLPKILITATSGLGFLLALALAVLDSVERRDSLKVESWIAFAAWVREDDVRTLY